MSESLHLTRNGPILEITLDRPKANAIDAKTSFAMGEAFLNFRDDPELRVAIITGGGEKFFSAGWDLKAAAEGEAPDADFGPGGFAGLTEIFDLDKPRQTNERRRSAALGSREPRCQPERTDGECARTGATTGQ